MAVEFVDNSRIVLRELAHATKTAMERIGQQAEGYAKDLCPEDTGLLRTLITHGYDEEKKEVYIGTASEYAPYVELGTGIYYPGGRRQPWVYQDVHGNWHRTSGNRPQPFLRPAMEDHIGTYKNIIKDELSKGG